MLPHNCALSIWTRRLSLRPQPGSPLRHIASICLITHLSITITNRGLWFTLILPFFDWPQLTQLSRPLLPVVPQIYLLTAFSGPRLKMTFPTILFKMVFKAKLSVRIKRNGTHEKRRRWSVRFKAAWSFLASSCCKGLHARSTWKADLLFCAYIAIYISGGLAKSASACSCPDKLCSRKSLGFKMPFSFSQKFASTHWPDYCHSLLSQPSNTTICIGNRNKNRK